jgi:monovalent cation/hydrogen antiporter
VVPSLPLAAAFALGALVAPPDATAALAAGRSAGLPRRVSRILVGEGMVNHATALTVLAVAVSATVEGGFSLVHGLGQVVLTGVGGVVLGLVCAHVAGRLLGAVRDPVLENAVLLLTPFAGHALAESGPVHVSGVLAVVVAGLVLGHRSPRRQGYATRMQGTEIWAMVEFLVESLVFALIGLQLPAVVAALARSDLAPGTVAAATAAVLAGVVVLRFVWIYPATYLPRLIPRVRRADPPPPWRQPTVLGWAGMRGVVPLAGAFALPAGFPERELVVFVTFVVVIATLLGQGTTFGPLIRVLGVGTDTRGADVLAEAAAREQAAAAALRWLDTAGADRPDDPVVHAVTEQLRAETERRRTASWERLGGPADGSPSALYRRLRLRMLTVERDVLVALRDAGHLDDEVLRRIQHDLDTTEAAVELAHARPAPD